MPASAPGSVTNLCAIADATGALSVKISFDAPTTDAKGNPLNELSKIEIYRNNDAIPAYTIESPTKGEEISWIDNNAIEGYNTYKIIPYDNQSNGIDVMCNIYVGFDIPSVVENLNIVGDATNSNCTLSWQAPMTGVNGGVVDTQSLSYNIYREENGVFKEIAINHSEQSFTDNVDHTGEQQIFRYSIKVNSSHGESAELYKNVILGTPYAIPFTENFTSVKTATTPWSFEATSYSSLSLTDYSSIGSGYNNDNGMVQFYKWEDTNDLVKAEMISPKINLNESLNPYVSFYIYHFASSNPTNYIQPYIISEDSEVIPLGEKILIKGEQNGWVKYSYPLTGFTDKRFINFVFDMETSEYSSRIFFDNFCIDDVLDHNLMLESFEGNEIIEIDGATYNVCIRNKGTLTSEQFEVKLFCNDQLIKSVTDSGLEAESTKTYEFTIDAPHISECGQERNLYAEISYDKDMKNTDNISQIINAVVYTPPYPVISDLEGSAVDYTTTLTWSQPSNILYNPVSDSFESYKLFAIDNIGNWTLTDLDKQRTISPRYGVTFTDAFSPKAWQVIDPQRINLYGTDVAPHSGYMCLFSMQSDGSLLNGTTTDVCNDDWLISPEIVGGSELKFWAMQPTMNYGGNEKFEVLYSTTDTDTNNFILIEEVELHNMATWNEYIYTLPKDAKHFAIRHTLSFFGLWLDDITYQPSDSFEEMNIDCYNIYRDGEQIGTSDINSYKDKGLEIGTYQYAVTTNFADYGESALSNTIDVEVKYSSVANINSGKHIVYSANGHIVIADANGESVAVYTSDGKTVARSIAVDNISISVEPGIYIVTIDSSTYKIIAK